MRANKEITILADDSEGTLEEMLKMIKAIGNAGHSFEIAVDLDEKEGLKDRTFYWDGDGADYIADVKVKEIKEVKESVMKNKRVQLKEFFTSAGETLFDAFKYTNVYSDIVESPVLKYYEDFKSNDSVVSEIKKYTQILKNLIPKLKASKFKINDKQAKAIDNHIYDGSDAYDDAGMFLENMPEFYDAQIRIFTKLLRLTEHNLRNERKVKGKEHLISDAVDLEEDVAMEEDDIIKEPNTVIDLDKKGIDVTLKKEAFVRTLIKLIERNTGKKVILKK